MDKRDEQTIDMFGCAMDDNLLSTNMDLVEDEANSRWPEIMRELYSLLAATLKKHAGDPNLSLILLSEICGTFGGLQIYLPKGKSLQKMMIDLQVWAKFTGDNTVELAREFNLTQREIWRITAKMRKLEMKRRQLDMFGDH